jgi:nucleotidyltransferase substrate binding protein (TIGR01987 family)
MALSQLNKALVQPKDEFTRDSAIKRFEFTFELSWKLLKEYCFIEGIEANSPRASIKEAFKIGLLEEDLVYLEMLRYRNLSSHTYREEVTEEIYGHLKTFAEVMGGVVVRVKKNLLSNSG